MAPFPFGTLQILLFSAAVFRFSFALSLIDNPRLTLNNPSNTTNGTLVPAGAHVPGRSPFVYVGDPSLNVFRIQTLEMRPNPCTLRSECELIAKGYFSQDVPSLHLKTNITSEIAGERSCILLLEDNFCAWAHVVQGRMPSCPPKKGTAVVTFNTLLMQGWIPEAKYGVEIKVDAGDLLASHIVADVQLRDPSAQQT